MTPLHWAAHHGNKDMFTLLLNKNIFALGCKNNDKKQTPIHIAAEAVANDSALKINQKICINTALNFFEDIDSITIDHPRHTEMLKKLVEAMFKPKDSVDSAEKTVADYLAQDAELKKRIRRILIKYYVSSGL
jgi:ankyrin repeat protein